MEETTKRRFEGGDLLPALEAQVSEGSSPATPGPWFAKPRLVLEWDALTYGGATIRARLVQFTPTDFAVENLVPDSMGVPRWVTPHHNAALSYLACELARRVS